MRPLTRVAALLVAVAAVAGCTSPSAPGPLPGTVVGRAIGLAGEPVADAEVRAGDRTARTDAEGRFALEVPGGGGWVTVRHPGYLSRTRAGLPGDPLLVRLTPDDGATVALHFGGDVMTGRRFFDPDEDGDRSDALITDPADRARHAELLAPVAPLLADADLTAVNVESPVVDDPPLGADVTGRTDVHPTKEYVFASGTGLPGGLADAGVDVVGLANNHQFDLLGTGVAETAAAFDAAGFAAGSGRFGLGADVDAAWQPAVRDVGGTRVALLGCTSISGAEHDIDYVAGPGDPGAAPCDEARVRAAVAAAAAASDLVVFSVHGGVEYERTPSETVRLVSAAARESGADLVVNHHPHVVGGVDWDGAALTAWSLGNLVFDQTVWPSFQSYLLAVHVRGGEVVRAYLEPLMVRDYVARGVGTPLGDRVARTAMGLSTGPFLVEDGAVELDRGPLAGPAREAVPVTGAPEGRIAELGAGRLVEAADPALVQGGHDLLWTGDLDAGVLGGVPGPLWGTGPGSTVVADGAGHVAQLRRGPLDTEPVLASTLHRMLLTNPGSAQQRDFRSDIDDDDPAATAPPPSALAAADAEVSFTGRVRATPGSQVEVRVAWYPDTRGRSSDQDVLVVDPGNGDWQPFRLDARTPPDAVAVAVQVRLAPPGGAATHVVDVDGMRLVEWLPRGTATPRSASHVRVFADTSLTVSGGGEEAGAALTEVPG